MRNQYRKKPVIIKAYRLTVENMNILERWCHGSIKGTKLPIEERIIAIQTLEGEMTVKIGDWIIRGVKGEFYPCRHDIFEATYEKVS